MAGTGRSSQALGAWVAVLLVGALVAGGATRPPATLVVAVASAIALGLAMAVAFRSERSLRLPPLALPPLILALLCAAQLVPLPPSLRARLTPEAERVARLVLAGLETPGAWRPLTVDVAATLNDAARLAGLVALAVALDALDRPRRDQLRMTLAAALGALLLVPALQALGAPLPRWILPAGELHGRRLFSLVNPNHVAAALAALLPTVLALAVRRRGVARLAMVALAMAGNLALIATASRAGVVIGVLAQVVALWALRQRGDVDAPRRVVVLVAVGLLLALMLVGAPLVERLRPVNPMQGFGRLRLWRAAIDLVLDHRWTGVGHGAFSLVIPRYVEAAGQLRFAFVENEYLQLFVDVGVPGALAVLAAVVLAARRASPALREHSLGAQAALIGLGALALHNVVDFNWEGAGVAGVALALGAVAFPSAGWSLSRPLSAGLGAAPLILVALAMGSWGRTAEVDAAASASGAQAEAAFRRHPSDGYLADLAAAQRLAAGDPNAVAWLDRALLLGPRDPWAHDLTARLLVRAGYRDQAAIEIRAALANSMDRDRDPLCLEAAAIFSSDDEDDVRRLVASVPADAQAQRTMIATLAARRRWLGVQRVAAAALEQRPDDAEVLRALIAAERERGDRALLGAQARHLVTIDDSVAGALLAAAALVDAHDPAGAARLLEDGTARLPQSVDLPILHARLLLDGGDVARARSAVEAALARAVTAADKVRLHSLLAEVEERDGHPSRAALERAAAAQLQR